MSRQSFASLTLSVRAPVAIFMVAALSGCFGGVKKPQPAELQPVVALVSASQSWSTRIGTVRFPLEVAVSGNTVALASGDGTVALLEATTGRRLLP